MSLQLTTRIYTRILDCGREEARLWHVLRAMDPQGTGKVLTTPAALAQLMDVGCSTVYRWLKNGLGTFWRGRRVVNGQTELYLSGIVQVVRSLGLGKLGAIAEVPIRILTRTGAKALSTQLDAQQLQRQAWWAANAQAKGNARKFILKPWERVASAISTGANEVGNKPFPKYALIDGQWQLPGASLTGIRKQTDWKCDRTIQRRLSNSWRKERDLEPVAKLRVAEDLKDPALIYQLTQSGVGYFSTDKRVYKVLPHTTGKYFVLLHNIYAEEYELLSCRRLRGRVKKMVERI